ncbi:unnamed protein product [Vitrella brassicaformis CCMP3155]|uniref:Uncharacterized protein n=1 Tax=Vitrella brassicaformis (strain CCMP3155) TaxID=1169540 RepID=A0A0G4FKI2_VITBC|nr:unnamed protein product [Vitrella brassicaformis CCMP3155]|eukprot:CEM14284.1 unnamed protein product [Vitrella brassicaformis CCMP3155]
MSRLEVVLTERSPTWQLASGIEDGTLSAEAALDLMDKHTIDPHVELVRVSDGDDEPRKAMGPLLHAAAHRYQGQAGAAVLDRLIHLGADVNRVFEGKTVLEVVLLAVREGPDILDIHSRPVPPHFLLHSSVSPLPSALESALPLIVVLLRHGATMVQGMGALRMIIYYINVMGNFSPDGAFSAKTLLHAVTQLIDAAQQAPPPASPRPSLMGEKLLSRACALILDDPADHLTILDKLLEIADDGLGEGDGARAWSVACGTAPHATHVMHFLLDKGFRPPAIDREALFDVDVLSRVAGEAGADVDVSGRQGDTSPPILYAAFEQRYSAVHCLIRHGASIDLALADDLCADLYRHRILSVYHSFINRSVPELVMQCVNEALSPLRAMSCVSRTHRVFSQSVAGYVGSFLVHVPPLPFSPRTTLGRNLNAALRFFLLRARDAASRADRQQLFAHTCFPMPPSTHPGGGEGEGEGEGEGGGQAGSREAAFGLRDVVHMLRCAEAVRYGISEPVVRGYGNDSETTTVCTFAGYVCLRGADGQPGVQRVEGWE